MTLRFKAEERCEFDRETKREQESDTKYVREYSGGFGGGKTTDKVVTTVTEWFWRFEVEYEMFAFVGSSEDEGKVELERQGGSPTKRCRDPTTRSAVAKKAFAPVPWPG